ncbi:hypothetical protein M885DRAFT_571578 [Pelagophyceae sp. CCMP2097]|nr:hypothetical protein M885DRAFT_571578 [Pelagophyceae sp. CCMP2097]
MCLLVLLALRCAGGAVPRRRVLGTALGTTGAAFGGAAFTGGACAALGDASGPRRTFVVTGASSGIGFAAAADLASKGHRVCLACRDAATAAETAARIPGSCGAVCDLGDLASVDAFADEMQNLGGVDGLLLIAGVDGVPRGSGIEPHFKINYLGHALLARRLLPQLRSRSGRVVTVSSEAMLDADLAAPGRLSGISASRGVAPHTAYANSKACCVLLADALRTREPELAVSACALPGRCATQIVRYELPQRAKQRLAMSPDQVARQARLLGLRTAAEGALLAVWLAESADAAKMPQETLWLDAGVPATFQAPWRTDAFSKELWDLTKEILDKRHSLAV